MDVLRQTFSLVPEFLRTAESDRVRNLMDTGIQLGRRFRALKLWMVLRTYGAGGIRAALAEHLRLAQLFASWVDAHETFVRAAPVPFSVVCFRAAPRGWGAAAQDDLNLALMARVNATGEVFISHTRLADRVTLRVAIGHLRTQEKHLARAWELIREHTAALVAGTRS
jgi:aromatic-L-amino-acid decarboxylase